MSAASTGRRLTIGTALVISAVFLIYIWDRVIVPIEALEIRKALGLSVPQIGLLGSVFTFGLMLAAIPSGIFAGRYGTRASLLLGATIFSLGTLFFGLVSSFGLLIFLRVLSGIGEGFYNVSLLSFLGRLTSKYRSLAVGFPATLFGVGIFLAPPVVETLQKSTGAWWPPFVILGSAGLLGTLAIALVVPKDSDSREASAKPITWGRIFGVLTPRTLAVYAVVAATGFVVYSYISLLQSYLRAENNLSAGAASLAFSLYGFGAAIGGVGMGIVGDLIGRGRFVTIGVVVAAICGACAFTITPSPIVSGGLSLILATATNGVYANCIALVQDHAGDDDVPIATGILAIIYYFMSAFSGYVVGAMAGSLGWAMTGTLAYAVPYLIILPFLFRLIWRPMIATGSVAAASRDRIGA